MYASGTRSFNRTPLRVRWYYTLRGYYTCLLHVEYIPQPRTSSVRFTVLGSDVLFFAHKLTTIRLASTQHFPYHSTRDVRELNVIFSVKYLPYSIYSSMGHVGHPIPADCQFRVNLELIICILLQILVYLFHFSVHLGHSEFTPVQG